MIANSQFYKKTYAADESDINYFPDPMTSLYESSATNLNADELLRPSS